MVLLVVGGSCTDAEESIEVPAGEVAIPPDRAGVQDLTRLDFVESRPDLDSFRGPIVVSRTHEGIVAASIIDVAAAVEMGASDPRQRGEPGPVVGGGETTVTSAFGVLGMPSLLFSPAPDTLVELSSRDLSVTELAEVAAELTVPLDAAGAVPGEVLGVLSGAFSAYEQVLSGTVGAYYEGGGAGISVTIAVATPGEQAAILGLTYQDPEAAIDLRTEASCCGEQALVPPRHRMIRGASATIATLTPRVIVLVLEGSSGLVITTQQTDGRIPPDDQLVAIAEGVRAGSSAQLDGLIQTIEDAEIDRQVAKITAVEADVGWEVVAEYRTETFAALITTGDSGRPGLDLTGPAICAVVEFADPPRCLTAGSPETPLMLAGRGSSGSTAQVFFGSLRHDVRSVELSFPGGSRPTEIYDLDVTNGPPSRVFIAVLTLDEFGRLTENLNALDRSAVVARDALGNELERAPMGVRLVP